MKKLIAFVLYLFPLIGIAQDNYTLHGQVSDTTISGTAYLRYMANSRPRTDSARVIKGKFILTAPLASIVTANLSVTPAKGGNDITSVYLEPRDIYVVSATPRIHDALITGSPVNDDAALLDKLTRPLDEKMAQLNKEWLAKSPAERADTVIFNQFNDRAKVLDLEYNALRKKFAFEHTDSYMGLFAYCISRAIDFKQNLATTEKDFHRFSPAVRASDLGKSLSSMIESARTTKGGLLAMDFTQSDVDGKPVKLSDFRGKYVLLDFWASWCKPCRNETPFLVKAYNNYKGKNFTILSVALEKPGDRASWVAAIQQDGMVWNNVSDLNYWQNDAAVKYEITSIPANFLIDPTGKVVAKNLRGKDLESKLAELLK